MARKINYDDWSREELVKELRRLKETRYGLVWHRDLPEEKIDVLINPDARTPNEMFPNEMAGKPFPILKEVKTKEVADEKKQEINLLIQGDNYHSLAVLNFTHREGIDLIYIDPPYNTCNDDFIYNDKFVPKEDDFRHSKWLSFIEKRLKLAKNLLKPSGAIFISIDDNEQAQLRMLCDEIFGENNFIANIPRRTKSAGKTTDAISLNHDYVLVYAKDRSAVRFQAISIDDKAYKYKDEYYSERGPYALSQTLDYDSLSYSAALDYELELNGHKYYPGSSKESFLARKAGKHRASDWTWRWGKELVKFGNENGFVVVKKGKSGPRIYTKTYFKVGIERDNGKYKIVPIDRAKNLSTLDLMESTYSNDVAKKDIRAIFGASAEFAYPKPVALIKYLVRSIYGTNSTVLDFFAGSGTTAQAVLELNKEDGGNRRFILCTNNENNIATDICYPRLKKIMQGYKDDIFVDGMFSYLAWLNARLWEMKRVLKSTGSIYVHCDWHASHYIKIEMDKIFGYDSFINEVVWQYKTGGTPRDSFSRKHDVILVYAKRNRERIFNPLKERSFLTHKYGFSGIEIKEASCPYAHKNGEQIAYYTEVGMRDVWDIAALRGNQPENIGYPTQKPEALLDRIIAASSGGGGVVADFFMGGGTTGVVALRNNRRFIGCDISRVAVSVTVSRLVNIAEEISGIVISSHKDKTLGFQVRPIADIQIGYVGSYPIDKFKGIAQQEFVDFVCRLYGAGVFTGKAEYIHGLANGKLIVSVGPADPDAKVLLSHVQGLVEEVVRQYAQQLKEGEERILQVVGWGFDPAIEKWKGQAITALDQRNVKLQIELVSLSSESFRQKIFRQIGEANLDLKFNRLNRLLSFSASPYAGRIVVDGQSGLSLKLRLDGAKAIGTGRLINCQWDFSYDGSRFASREHALNREGTQGNFEAKLDIEHAFEQAGEYTIAARVQDNLDGEAVAVVRLKIANGAIQEIKA